jgi:hypothetical protein
MSVAFNLVDSFKENLAEGAINLGGTGLTVALTNTAHTAAWDELADLTQISYTNLSSRVITVTSSAQTSGTYKLVLQDLTLTSSTGDVGPFRYVYIYDDASTGDKLIGYYDYGEAITLHGANGDTFTIDFDAANGALTLA